MPRSEKNELEILIQSLDRGLALSFLKKIENEKSINQAKQALLKSYFKAKKQNKALFLKKYKISSKQYNSIKYQLFRDLISFVQCNYKSISEFSLELDIIEYDFYLNNGLDDKAIQKLRKIKKIAVEQCDFNTCCTVQRMAIEYRIFKNNNKSRELEIASKELKQYHLLSANLIAYELLSDEVLNLHYQYLDKRILERSQFLNYLNHDLLKDEGKAQTVLSKYLYYRIHSLIALGDNNYEDCKHFSLQAFNFLKQNYSPYRNDFLRNIRAINNYLDASLNLKDASDFNVMFDEMQLIYQENKDVSKAFTELMFFQLSSSLKLNYYWVTKNLESFMKEVKSLEDDFNRYKEQISPNLKLEILLGFARLYFLNDELNKADEYCDLISKDKSNPASLYISSGNLLRVMINYDMGNYKLLPHLTRVGKYMLKNRNRLFELEKCFLNGILMIKSYYSKNEKKVLFKKLYDKIFVLIQTSNDTAIDDKISILEWLKLKCEL